MSALTRQQQLQLAQSSRFPLPSIRPGTLGPAPAHSPPAAEFETQTQRARRRPWGCTDLPWTHFLGIAFCRHRLKNSRNWLAFLSFRLNLSFSFFPQPKKQSIFRPLFLNFGVNFLTILLGFHVKINVLVSASRVTDVIMVASPFSDNGSATLLR